MRIDGAVTRAREYLRGIRTDGYRYDHPITILAALVAEIDAAPVVDIFKYRGSIVIEPDDESVVGKRVRLVGVER